MKALVTPPAAQRDPHSVQMLSAWIAEQGMHCTLNIGMWTAHGRNEASAWGILLADAARHVANALEEEQGLEKEVVISEIIAALLRELNDPTSAAPGNFSPGHS